MHLVSCIAGLTLGGLRVEDAYATIAAGLLAVYALAPAVDYLASPLFRVCPPIPDPDPRLFTAVMRVNPGLLQCFELVPRLLTTWAAAVAAWARGEVGVVP